MRAAATLLLLLPLAVLAQDADDYPGTEVPGTRTPIAFESAVLGSPQRGYVRFAPRTAGGPSPWNCLAHAKGKTGIWIQPGDGARGKPGGAVVQVATMSEILADNGCTIVPCADPPEATACPPPAQLVWLVYGLPKNTPKPAAEQLPDDDYWLHAMRRTPDGTWTSKDGERERRDGIRDPYAVLPFYFNLPGEQRVIRCACCPMPGDVLPPSTIPVSTTSSSTPRPDATVTTTSTPSSSTTTTTTGPLGQAVRLDHPLGPNRPAGSIICLNRLVGGYQVEGHRAGCDGLHLHSIPEIGLVVLVGDRQEGPYLDPNPTGCGYGRIVLAVCPPVR